MKHYIIAIAIGAGSALAALALSQPDEKPVTALPGFCGAVQAAGYNVPPGATQTACEAFLREFGVAVL